MSNKTAFAAGYCCPNNKMLLAIRAMDFFSNFFSVKILELICTTGANCYHSFYSSIVTVLFCAAIRQGMSTGIKLFVPPFSSSLHISVLSFFLIFRFHVSIAEVTWDSFHLAIGKIFTFQLFIGVSESESGA